MDNWGAIHGIPFWKPAEWTREVIQIIQTENGNKEDNSNSLKNDFLDKSKTT